ncbi:MAG: 50S ribosomal protein L10 [Candidatus Gracilibacteria bacterium]|nr:50S ribosomal protein L10 [Candidatus Gracilibacteria bacterium]
MKKDFFIKLIIIKMALTRTKKKEVLSSLIEKLKVANSVGFTTNKALTVEEVTNLRVNLREVNAEFHLAKKLLLKLLLKKFIMLKLMIHYYLIKLH